MAARTETNKTRYTNLQQFYFLVPSLKTFILITGSEYDCLNAKGTNDVGWHLLPGNYGALRQIDANVTSAGYWNVNPEM